MPTNKKAKKPSAQSDTNAVLAIGDFVALANNRHMSIGTDESPLTVVFPKSDYDEGNSIRMTLSASGDSARYLKNSEEARTECKLPITYFKQDNGSEPTLQLAVKAIDSDQVVVFEEGQPTASLTDTTLKRGDTVSIIVRTFEYVNRKITKANTKPMGMSIQVWAVRILARGTDTAKAVMPTRMYSLDDF